MSRYILVKAGISLIALAATGTIVASQLGYGNTRCSIYTAVQKENGALGANIDAWTLGYLSGLNHADVASGKPDRIRRHQPDRIAAYIRTYCEAQADETVEQAANSYWVIALGE